MRQLGAQPRLQIHAGMSCDLSFPTWRPFTSSVDPGKPTTAIIAEGPFRWSRNPMYLSLVALMAGLAVWLGSAWFALFTVVLWVLLDFAAVRPEEGYLEQKFGAEFELS